MPVQKKKRSKTKVSRSENPKAKDKHKEEKKIQINHSSPKKKEALHIGKIAPLNILEQQTLFFNTNCLINPILLYPEGSNLIGYTEKFQPHNQYLNAAINILENGLLDYKSESNFYQSEYSNLSQSKTLEEFQVYLDTLGIRNTVEIIFSPSAIAPTAVTHNPKTLVSQITVGLPISYCKERIQGVMNHEIGTHLLRTLNERKQIWYKKRDKYGLGAYIETEEGLASLHTMLDSAFSGRRKPYLWRAALHYYSSYYASMCSFVELYQRLDRYMDDPVKRFKEVLRVKRGISNTGLPGGCYKDQVYLSGAIKILQRRKDIDFYKLYCGKLSLEDLFRQEILDLCDLSDIKIPVFLSDIQKYKQALDYIARTNGVE
ncbi:hypothetical protein SteCoe_30832 [Stentor coeruleus]|uniref:DUF1704 domain-containing protein n=1 Tax=Stentor coeruleus TaxID=5963 RepID=A0A1R2B2N5_9CILI|nr:hypothetical protein SteCoe_30832 [Stentor coeruleus]